MNTQDTKQYTQKVCIKIDGDYYGFIAREAGIISNNKSEGSLKVEYQQTLYRKHSGHQIITLVLSLLSITKKRETLSGDYGEIKQKIDRVFNKREKRGLKCNKQSYPLGSNTLSF